MKGLGVNIVRDIKVGKACLLAEIQSLDVRADGVGQSNVEWLQRYALEDKLIAIFYQNEIYWRQRAALTGFSLVMPTWPISRLSLTVTADVV